MEVKVYSTKTCPYCVMVKDYLTSKSIAYQNFDVSQDAAAREEMVKISGQMGVPVISIDGKIIIGFDKDKIDSFL
ncbi:MAG: glutaredoxin family protein [Candidatus Omnitrophica bacterium]|nr:glutaredoxin family protein [Candidatus Omnitrophota bacterium]